MNDPAVRLGVRFGVTYIMIFIIIQIFLLELVDSGSANARAAHLVAVIVGTVLLTVCHRRFIDPNSKARPYVMAAGYFVMSAFSFMPDMGWF